MRACRWQAVVVFASFWILLSDRPTSPGPADREEATGRAQHSVTGGHAYRTMDVSQSVAERIAQGLLSHPAGVPLPDGRAGERRHDGPT